MFIIPSQWRRIPFRNYSFCFWLYCIDPQKLQLYIVVLGANHNHLSLCKGRDKIFRFFLGNSVIFQFTDQESYISIKYQPWENKKTTGTLWYQFIEFPLLYYWLSVKYKSYFGSSVELTFVYLSEGCGKTYVRINDAIPHTWIVWDTRWRAVHISIQEVSAIRRPLTFENFHIFT